MKERNDYDTVRKVPNEGRQNVCNIFRIFIH